jgi:signal transduction histidine kinase
VIRGREQHAALADEFPPDMTWSAWHPPIKYARTKEKRGSAARPGGLLVWVRDTAEGHDDDTVLVALTDIEPRRYRALFWGGGGFALLVLVAVTVLGVRFFLNYVRERDDFLAATAHDLTTPLVGMRYLVGRDDEQVRALNERLLRLVGNIKDFLRLGGRRPPPRRAPFPVGRAFDEAYGIFAADYEEETSGPVAVSGDPSLVVCADETLVVQILWNLLGNNLKYAAPFGPVRVRFSEEGACVRVDFVDEGQGLSPRQMRRAFDRYYRARTVLVSGKGGFGIGLCTSREFARAMGGDISVRANTPKGCVFTLRLPRADG